MIGPIDFGFLVILAVWAACFAVPTVVYVRKAKLPRRRTVGWIFFIAHLILVIAMGINIHVGARQSGESYMAWLLFDLLDFPSSMIHFGLSYAIAETLLDTFMVSNFWLPLVSFAVFGSFQYFLIGVLVGAIMSKVSPQKWERKLPPFFGQVVKPRFWYN